MDAAESQEVKKQHRKKLTGNKKKKSDKRNATTSSDDLTARQRNPKAFAFHSADKVARQVRRTLDIESKKHHVPLVVNQPTEPPPVIVGVIGPSKVGKTTLIKCLVKNYTREKMSEIKGPVTIVSGKKRRLTLIECNNDISSMIDIAKVADLVLLLVDASFGFEMETFEFLNVCQVHGFPRIMGVLTHLDLFKQNKQLKKIKKQLKDRFWTEIYQGAKLFYLSGMKNGEYSKMEVHNLGRFISVMKFRPLQWRTTHPYVLVDRFEDLTNSEETRENQNCDRTVSLYGYVHGAHLKDQSVIHIPGCGDFTVNDMRFLPDPCPLPETEKKRSLTEKERMVYAPFSGVGGIVFDKDAIYIDIGGSHQYEKQSTEMAVLAENEQTIDSRIEESGLQMFSNADLIASKDYDVDGDASDDDSSSDGDDVSDESTEEKNDEYSLLKDDVMKRAASSYFNRQRNSTLLRKMLYDHDFNQPNDNDGDDEIGGLFRRVQPTKVDTPVVSNVFDCSLFPEETKNLSISELKEEIKDCFVTGRWAKDEDAQDQIDADDELGDFEDLEESDDDVDMKSDEGDIGEGKSVDNQHKPGRSVKLSKEEQAERKLQKRLAKKAELKKLFDAEYDDASGGKKSYFDDLKMEVDQQAQLNRSEFENLEDEVRCQYEGFRPGLYVRIEIKEMPAEFIQNFDPSYPIIVGGQLSQEDTNGYIQVRLKKHRWYDKILKTRDPLIISLGWRRFQTIAVYSTQDHNMRSRMLKYTPEHVHCFASFWGPVTPQGTGLLAIQAAGKATPGFRICATGVVTQISQTVEITKKLKLTGVPFQIFKKTAFIKDMFNSQLEVAKFEGGAIKTVSGIRGQIKKPLRTPEGSFRATFEDKIVLSDIVFMRTWYVVDVPKLYNPLPTLLLPNDQKLGWQGMRTVSELRRDLDIKPPSNADSHYKPVEREPKHFKPLEIPRTLQKELPFKDKPKITRKPRDTVQENRPAVILEPEEKRVRELMKMVRTLHSNKKKEERLKTKKRVTLHRKEMRQMRTKRENKQRELKRDIYRAMNKMNPNRTSTVSSS